VGYFCLPLSYLSSLLKAVEDADQLLNAMLEGQPKAELMRDLTGSLDEVEMSEVHDRMEFFLALDECVWTGAELKEDELILTYEERKKKQPEDQ
jgi:hypothetical protein